MPPKVAQMIREQEEKKILKEFEEDLEYRINTNDEKWLILSQYGKHIDINKKNKTYECYLLDVGTPYVPIEIKEHYLLHKLFELWGWFDEL